jgi:hypothetical protein
MSCPPTAFALTRGLPLARISLEQVADRAMLDEASILVVWRFSKHSLYQGSI